MSLIRLLSLSVVWEEKMLTRLPPFLRPVDLESFYAPWFTDRGESSQLNYITIWRYRTGTAKTAKKTWKFSQASGEATGIIYLQVNYRLVRSRCGAKDQFHVAGGRINFTLQGEGSMSGQGESSISLAQQA
jgi:hypothetical protein